ncbi:MAG: 16S rRNA (adenine(1518)-N(6)/adenine(1519)-N(6))-dimethyltransferase RsmA [Pseudomonadota bacterium]
MHAKKRFGQNFLHDRHMIDKIVRSIVPKNTDTIVEIGPGRGAISFPLLASGCRLEAVEIDKDLIPGLMETCPNLERFHLHNADALTFDFSSIGNSFRLVGNLPYNISTPLLFHLMNFTSHIIDIHVMLQREVVDRIVAEPNNKTYGRLSVMLQYYCEAERLFLIPPGVFDPAPKVDSALLRLVPKKNRALNLEQEKNLEEIVKLAFGQRRKTLRNNLKTMINDEQWKKSMIDSQLRAENLSVEDFVTLTKEIEKNGNVCNR